MSTIGIALETLLGVLLIVALLFGIRLERRLRKLRDMQDGFMEAVASLDHAAARAAGGLETLRHTAEDAQEGLHSRISKARELKADLEKLIARAERAAEILNNPPQTTAPKLTLSAPDPKKGRVMFTEPESDEAPLELTEFADPVRPARAPLPQRTPRSGARGVDEDLFASPGPLKPRRIFGVRS
jgi:hypothetical protein